MGCNYYKMLPQFKQHLKGLHITGDIRYDVFLHEVMRFYGFTEETAKKWIRSFEELGYLRFDNNNVGGGSVVSFV